MLVGNAKIRNILQYIFVFHRTNTEMFICHTLVVQPDSSSCECFHGDGLICVSR